MDIANLGKLRSIAGLKAQAALARFRDAKAECDLVIQEITRLQTCQTEPKTPSDQVNFDRWQRWREGKLKELTSQLNTLRETFEREKMNAVAQEGRRIVVDNLLEMAMTERQRALVRKSEAQPLMK